MIRRMSKEEMKETTKQPTEQKILNDFEILQAKEWSRFVTPPYRIVLVVWKYTRGYIDYLNRMGNHLDYSLVGTIRHYSTHEEREGRGLISGNYYDTFEEARADFDHRF